MTWRRGGSAFRWAGIILLIMMGLSACSRPDKNQGLAAPNSVGTVLPKAGETGAAETPEIPLTGNATSAAPGYEENSVGSGWLASQMLNATVSGPADDALARVAGLVVDAANGQVLYLALTGETLADRMVLVPWQLFTLTTAENNAASAPGLRVQLAVPAADLAGAPDFSEEAFNVSSGAADHWDAQIRNYWSGRNVDELPADSSLQPILIKGEGLQRIDDDLQAANGDRLGEIKDLMLGSDGVVRFALLDFDQPAQNNNGNPEQVIVAWRELAWLADQKAFQLIPVAESLQNAPRLTADSPVDLSLPGWDQDWQAYWTSAAGAQPTQTVEGGQTGGSGAAQAGDQRLLGQALVTNSAETLGIVEDWLLNTQGQVEFVAVTTLPGPGQGTPNQTNPGQGNRARGINPGGRWVLVPWNVVKWDNGTLLFLESPKVFNNAPAFDTAESLDRFEDWKQPVNDYWQDLVTLPAGTTPTPEGQSTQVWISSLLESEMNDSQGQPIGNVAGVILDAQASLRYLIVSDGSRYRPVPWEYVDDSSQQDDKDSALMYTDDPQRLSDAPGFDSLEAALAISTTQESELRSYWGLKEEY